MYSCRRVLILYLSLILTLFFLLPSQGFASAPSLDYKQSYSFSELFPAADEFREVKSKKKITTAYKDKERIGYIYVTSDIVDTTGYSGKPIKILVGVKNNGDIVGVKMIEHHEPIILAGISQSKFDDFIKQHENLNVFESGIFSADQSSSLPPLISSATVTAMIVTDTIIKSALKVIKIAKQAEDGIKVDQPKVVAKELDTDDFVNASWDRLLENGAIRRLNLKHDYVRAKFDEIAPNINDSFDSLERTEDDFIDLYLALINPISIGKNLLGEEEYNWLISKKLTKDDYAILVAANGDFSFRGSGFVRGKIFDRIKVTQAENSYTFRDQDYKRIGRLLSENSPEFKEIGIFVINKSKTLDSQFIPTDQFKFHLLANKSIGALERVYTSFSFDYKLPDTYLAGNSDQLQPDPEPLWKKVWQERVLDVIFLLFMLATISAFLLFQDFFAKYPKLLAKFKFIFMAFTLLWLGFYVEAQLSVVNVLMFVNSVAGNNDASFLLYEPLILILWIFVGVTLILWGRGIFCGWLCPFGIIQEFTHAVAKLVKIPDIKVSLILHERLLVLKYLILFLLVGISFYSFDLAELFAEVEPFKTTISLKFIRSWEYLLYAIIVIAIGLLIERFYCRYICPLGAALAIVGKLQMFNWLRRRKECGPECKICEKECSVQAIDKNGAIDTSECFYCIACQETFYNDNKCLPLIRK